MSSSTAPCKRRQIEDSTAARLAEIVAAAEQAAKQVIDEAEEEARERLSDAHEEADRIVAERLAALVELTDEIGAQAEALKRGAEALQAALAGRGRSSAAPNRFGGSTTMRGPSPAPQPDDQRPIGPSLTVVGSLDRQPPLDRGSFPTAPDSSAPGAGPREPAPNRSATGPRAGARWFRRSRPPTPPEPRRRSTPAGARLLATQMAVSGSSREEIEARLRSGFAIADTGRSSTPSSARIVESDGEGTSVPTA